jgi:hypothetical protein
MASPHPYELFDEGDEIKILSHEGNATRTVHMNGADDTSQQAPSYLGYSVGRWDESTLVVEISRINWSLYRPGTPQSELVTVVERFSLSEDQRRLHYQSTTTDSETFTTPGILERYYGALGETVAPYECEVDE